MILTNCFLIMFTHVVLIFNFTDYLIMSLLSSIQVAQKIICGNFYKMYITVEFPVQVPRSQSHFQMPSLYVFVYCKKNIVQ